MEKNKLQEYINALKILEEIEQRYEKEYGNLLNYKPSPTQYEFHTSLSKERVLLGANKSGKSHAGAIETCWHITGIYPDWYPKEGRIKPDKLKDRDVLIIVNVETLDKVKDNIIPYFRKFIKNSLKYDMMFSGPQKYVVDMHFENGARVKFTSNRMKTEALEGGEADFFWSDEPPTQEHYVALLRAFLRKHSRLIITATALKFGWLTQHFLDPPESLRIEREKLGPWAIPWVKSMPLSENIHLTDEEKAYWTLSLKSISLEEAQARLEGIPFQKIGRVFGQDFDVSKHICPQKILKGSDYSLYFSIDPHDKKGPAMIWIAVRKPDDYGVCQKVVVHCHYDEYNYMTPKDIVRYIRHIEEDVLNNVFDKVPPVIGRFIDPRFAEHGQAGIKYVDLLMQSSVEEHYPMGFKKGSGCLTSGHNAIRDMLRGIVCYNGNKEPEFLIMDNCIQLIEAFKFYSYKYGEEGVEEQYKDMIDCLRYAVTNNIYYYNVDAEENYTRKFLDFLSYA